jgi:hypothetical protein
MKMKLYQRGEHWHLPYHHRGTEQRQACGTTDKAQAEQFAKELEAKLLTGTPVFKDIRLDQLVKTYIDDANSSKRGRVAKRADDMWRLHLAPFFQRAKISELGTTDSTEYRLARIRRVRRRRASIANHKRSSRPTSWGTEVHRRELRGCRT